MDCKDIALNIILFLPIAAMLIFSVAAFFYCIFFRRAETRKISALAVVLRNKKLLIFTFIAIVNLFSIILVSQVFVRGTNDIAKPVNIEEFARFVAEIIQLIGQSVMRTMQSFGGMDDFPKYLEEARAAFDAVIAPYCENTSGIYNYVVTAFISYAGIIGIIAPITSFAFIIDVLTTFLPKAKLRLHFLKKKYFFSELNAGSLELAKNILDDTGIFKAKPLIIFTDVRTAAEDDKANELVLEARAIGALCIRDDIMHVRKKFLREKKFFLIDENEAENVHKLAELSSDKNNKFLKNSEIYLFCADGIYDKVRDGVITKLTESFGGEKNKDKMPAIVPVYTYRNLASRLLYEVPAYESIVHNAKTDVDTPVYFTIFGTGKIGTEMFLCAYRTCQMLGTKLHITVVSDESEADFRGRIDYINPDIMNTSVVSHPILTVNEKGETNAPYFSFSYTQCNITSGNMRELLDTHIKNSSAKIRDTHYFVVALGSDAHNIAVSEKLRQHISEYHLDHKDKRTVITYAVYNSELCDMFNRNKCCFSFNSNKCDVYMHAFGNLSEEYSVSNILMKDKMSVIAEIQQRYENSDKSADEALSEERKNKVKKALLRDEYGYSADIARAMHIKYKLFSAGLINVSLFDCKFEIERDDKDDEKSKKRRDEAEQINNTADELYMESYMEAFRKYAATDFIPKKDERLEMFHRLAWLEHRRWCADLRTRGFRTSPQKVLEKTHMQKDLSLKLHSCLVECDMLGIKDEEFDKNTCFLKGCDNNTGAEKKDNVSYDLLDSVTAAIREYDPKHDNFKKYDYINHEPLTEYNKNT